MITGGGAGPPSERIPWPDVVRGVCVLAVIVFHVVEWLGLAGATGPAAALWARINESLNALRMPALIGVSGVFALRGIQQGIGGFVPRRRAAWFVYLYVVWLAIYAVFALAIGRRDLPDGVSGPMDWLRQLLLPGTGLWFIFAIGIYTLVLALAETLRIPRLAVLPALAILHITAEPWADHPGWGRLAYMAIFFAVGAYAGGLLCRLCQQIRPWQGAVILGGCAAVPGVGQVLEVRGYYIATGCAALLGASVLAVWVSRWRLASEPLAWVGRHTFPVFVLHPLFVWTLLLLQRGGAFPSASELMGSPAGFFAPLAISSGLVAACLILEALLRRVGAGAFFALPRAAERWLRRQDVRSTVS